MQIGYYKIEYTTSISNDLSYDNPDWSVDWLIVFIHKACVYKFHALSTFLHTITLVKVPEKMKLETFHVENLVSEGLTTNSCA